MMKSNDRLLIQRGYIEQLDLDNYQSLNKNDLVNMLSSKLSYERTIAVRLLVNRKLIDESIIDVLLEQLTKEKSLYTRIEIQNAISLSDEACLYKILPYLGTLSNHQYQEVPSEPSKKKSYPLPRDLIARSIAKIDVQYLTILLDALFDLADKQVSELIDAIGYICFYQEIGDQLFVFQRLEIFRKKHLNNPVIQWKMITVYSAFDLNEVERLLENIIHTYSQEHIYSKEAIRSLKIINERIEVVINDR